VSALSAYRAGMLRCAGSAGYSSVIQYAVDATSSKPPSPLPTLPAPFLRARPPIGDSLGSAGVRYFTAGYCGTTPSSQGYPEGDGVLTTRCRRSTARVGRGMFENDLDGTLPAELGKLTDLEDLCAALRRRRAALRRTGRHRMLTRCGGAQRLWHEQAPRHDRQLDRLDGEAHVAVSAALHPGRYA
jgi:hypothetical protein